MFPDFHKFRLCLSSALVVIAKQVKDTMQKQEIQFTFKRGLRLNGITRCRLGRDHHVAKQVWLNASPLTFLHRKGDDVGGAILAQVIAVNLLDPGIVNNQYREPSIRTSRGA